MAIHLWVASLSFSFHFGSGFKRREFAPVRDFFPFRVDPFVEPLVVQGTKQEVTKVVVPFVNLKS